MKAEMLLFSNPKTGGLRGDLQSVDFSLKINVSTKIFKIISKNFEVEFTLCKSPRTPDMKKATSQLSLKKINIIAFLYQILPQFKSRCRKQSKNVDSCSQTRKAQNNQTIFPPRRTTLHHSFRRAEEGVFWKHNI